MKTKNNGRVHATVGTLALMGCTDTNRCRYISTESRDYSIVRGKSNCWQQESSQITTQLNNINAVSLEQSDRLLYILQNQYIRLPSVPCHRPGTSSRVHSIHCSRSKRSERPAIVGSNHPKVDEELAKDNVVFSAELHSAKGYGCTESTMDQCFGSWAKDILHLIQSNRPICVSDLGWTKCRLELDELSK